MPTGRGPASPAAVRDQWDQWRPFIHVSDVAQAIVRAIEAPLANVKGQTFNVGGDDLNCTILAAAEEIGRAVPDARLVMNRGNNGALHAMRSQPIDELYAIRSIAPRYRPSTAFHDRRRSAPGRRASDHILADASRSRVANVAQA